MILGSQRGGIPDSRNELIANAGRLDVQIHQQIGGRQREDRRRSHVDDVGHLAVSGLRGDGLVEAGAATLISPVDLGAGVSRLELGNLLLEERSEIGLQTLRLESDFAFHLRGVNLACVNILCGDIAGNGGLRDAAFAIRIS